VTPTEGRFAKSERRWTAAAVPPCHRHYLQQSIKSRRQHSHEGVQAFLIVRPHGIIIADLSLSEVNNLLDSHNRQLITIRYDRRV